VLKLLSALLLSMAVAAPSSARQAPACAGIGLEQARLAGQGTYRFFGLEIYSAQLWIGSEALRGELPGAQPFALELEYSLGLRGERIADASVEQMLKVGVGTPDQRQAWHRQMIAVFPDVKPGTRLCGLYLPDQGVRFYLDGKLRATVADVAFARAFFSIWLSSNTTAKPLRSALLKDAGIP
jgi:hypothetical protein